MHMSRGVIIYGAGAMGTAVLHLLENKGEKIEAVVDKNDNLTGSFIDGVKIITPDLVQHNQKQQCDFIVSMSACSYKEIEQYLDSIGVKHIYNAGDYIQTLYPEESFAGVWKMKENEYEELLSLNDFWSDELSKLQYMAALNWFKNRNEKISTKKLQINRIKYYPDVICNSIKNCTTMVDTGIRNGEFIRTFEELSSSEIRAYGFMLHPDIYRIEDVRESFKDNSDIIVDDYELSDAKKEITISRLGLMDPFTEIKNMKIHTTTLDDYFKKIPYDFLRIYSMSSVINIISGGKQTIETYRPVIAVNISHYHDDFIDVPRLLKLMLNDYNFYFRMHSFQGNDCIFYAIPQDGNN